MDIDEGSKKYTGKVNGTVVKGDTHKEFIINYLTAVFNEYKNLDNADRLMAYIDYFVKNFEYDKELREKILSKAIHDSFAKNKESLFRLLHDGKGVCGHFSKALTLLCVIDNSYTNDAIIPNFVNCRLSVNGREMGHAINAIRIGDEKTVIIDISSMIHSRDKDYNQDKKAFGPIYLEDYIKNLERENITMLPNVKTSNYITGCLFFSDVDKDYELLNLPVKDLEENHQKHLFRIELPHKHNQTLSH